MCVCLLVDPHPKKTDGDYKVAQCVPQVWQYLLCHGTFAVTEKRDPVASKMIKPNDDRLVELEVVCAHWFYGSEIGERSCSYRAQSWRVPAPERTPGHVTAACPKTLTKPRLEVRTENTNQCVTSRHQKSEKDEFDGQCIRKASSVRHILEIGQCPLAPFFLQGLKRGRIQRLSAPHWCWMRPTNM